MYGISLSLIMQRANDLLQTTRPPQFHQTSQQLQDGIEQIEAAYEVFLQGADQDEWRSFIVELRTKAMLNLSPSRVREYLRIISEKDGEDKCQKVMAI